MTPRSSRQDATAAIDDSTLVTALTTAPSAQLAIAQRFSALALNVDRGLLKSAIS